MESESGGRLPLTLGEVISNIDELTDEQLLNSDILVPEGVLEANQETPIKFVNEDVEPYPNGWRYFLEIDSIREALDAWRNFNPGAALSLQDAIRAVNHYAENDAFLPPLG